MKNGFSSKIDNGIRTGESSGRIMKRIRFSKHAQEQAVERGTTRAEVEEAIRKGSREPAVRGREMCRYNFVFNRKWQGKHYSIKQVAPVITEEANETVVITVYTFYF
jgi:hypothetical protein